MKLLKVLLFIFLFSIKTQAQQIPDTTFAIDIDTPAFDNKNAPRVYIDGGHNNLHQKHTGFLPLTKLLEKDGFIVRAKEGKITKLEVLVGCDIFVIANALHTSNIGNWVTPNPSAFSKLEIKAINQWVKNGGSLLLIADHMPYGGAAQQLAQSFGIEWQNSFVGAGSQVWPPNMFTTANNTLKPISSEFYNVDTVASFTGSAFKLPKKGKPLLLLTNVDTALITDTAWQFTTAKKIALDGFVQGGLLNYGKGKVAVFGEAAMFTAQLVNGQYKVGFNSPIAKQNIPFILNVFYALAQGRVKDKKGFTNRVKGKH